MKILVADDDIMMTEVTVELLKGEGHRAEGFDPGSAPALIAGGEFDVLITNDVDLAVNTGRHTKTRPVIMASSPEKLLKASLEGIPTLVKPFGKEGLDAVLRVVS